jgi:DNA replication protein DnaC
MSSEGESCVHISEHFIYETFDSFRATDKATRSALDAAQRFAAGEFRHLLLSGPPGCGKTHLLAAACNRVASRLQDVRRCRYDEYQASTDPAARRNFEQAWALAMRAEGQDCPAWVTVPLLLPKLRRELAGRQHDPEEISAASIVEEVLATSGLLVLDDLGAEKATEWTFATLFELVEDRYTRELPIAVTSNLSAEQLDAAGYTRIVSRLVEDGVLLTMASAKDHRLRLKRPAGLRVVEGGVP